MSQQRRLAAIMFTDIEGYTSLMHLDEKKAVEMREKHRNIFKRITAKHNGTIIQYFGDGTLSTFKSSVGAVECAIELQHLFTQDPRIPVRIGIHVGDIMYKNDDIIGDAVNVASRIESCAVIGSVLISDKVHDQIRSHQHIKTEFLDAYELKNVEDAMPIFAVANEGLVVPKPEDIKGKLKERSQEKKNEKNHKFTAALLAIALLSLLLAVVYFQYFKTDKASLDYSIAVLPFENMSTDKNFEFFTDGMTEDILTQLSKVKALHVISRTSVMQYKNTKKTIPEIAQELGVSYILEGSIRKSGDKIRVTAQLINANGDEHVWAENYDKTLTDIFAVQTEVSREIVDALELNLSFEEKQQMTIVPTKNMEAYKLFLTGRKEADKRTKESLAKSILLYKEAIAIDSNYTDAYAEIANSIYLETYYSRKDLQRGTLLAMEYLDKAEKINPNVSRIYTARGMMSIVQGKQEFAEEAFEKAIRLSPNDLTARHQFATFYYYTKQYQKQLEQAKIAYKLDPLSFATAKSYFNALLGNHKTEEAKQLLERIQSTIPDVSEHVMDISYFRLYMDLKKYKEVIPRLNNIVLEEKAFYRFLGFCYAKEGDTINAHRIIDSIKMKARPRERSYQLAVVYSGLKATDSVFYYLDTVRNKQTRTFKREKDDFFDYLNEDARFLKILNDHGISPRSK